MFDLITQEVSKFDKLLNFIIRSTEHMFGTIMLARPCLLVCAFVPCAVTVIKVRHILYVFLVGTYMILLVRVHSMSYSKHKLGYCH